MANEEVEWYIPYRVMLMKSSGKVTLMQLQDGIKKMKAMLDEASQQHDQRIYTILDQREVLSMPPVKFLMQEIQPLRDHPSGGKLIIVTDNRVLSLISSLMTHLTGAPITMTTTMEEAAAYLRRIEPDMMENKDTR
jgi:hypothetical protein